MSELVCLLWTEREIFILITGFNMYSGVDDCHWDLTVDHHVRFIKPVFGIQWSNLN